MPPKTSFEPAEVVVHPLVLLSVVDHFNRVARDTKKRVVGVLLGESANGRVDVTNSYAVPFEEDPKDPTIWFVDHNYHEDMFAMQRKVNAKEKVVGWYSTGPHIQPSDLEIDALFRRYTANPVLVIIDVNPREDDVQEIPTTAYLAVEVVEDDGKAAAAAAESARRTFEHIPSEVGAYEAEEVGVEHLLRDVRDTTVSTLTDDVNAKLLSLRGLRKRVDEMRTYLDEVAAGELQCNPRVVYLLQDIFNLAPNLEVGELARAFHVSTNDSMVVLYLSSLVRSILALHDLVNNKAMNRDAEQKERDDEAAAEAAAVAKAAEKKKKRAAKTAAGGDKPADETTPKP